MIADFKTRKIHHNPKTLNRLLKKSRLTKGYSLAKVEKLTKIKLEYLKMMEEDQINNLPEDIYVRGFLRSLAKLYGLDEVELIDCYRQKKDSPTPKEIKKIDFRNSRIKKPNFVITPRIISIVLVILIGLGLMAYLWMEVSGFAVAPKLVLSSPTSEEIEIKKSKILLEGQTDNNASITINNESIPVNNEGTFKENIDLQPGYNILNIKARNQGDKITSKTLQIVVDNNKGNGKISKVRGQSKTRTD